MLRHISVELEWKVQIIAADLRNLDKLEKKYQCVVYLLRLSNACSSLSTFVSYRRNCNFNLISICEMLTSCCLHENKDCSTQVMNSLHFLIHVWPKLSDHF